MRFLRLPEVKHLTQLSRSSIYKGIKDNTFPSQVKLSARCVAWTEESIHTWMASKLSAANDES